jgi:cytidylate kinase
MNNYVIAIDGPAASGKSSVAKKVAEKMGGFYINTGNMYRAVALMALKGKINFKTADEETFKDLLSKLSITYLIKSGNQVELTINNIPASLNEIRSHEVSLCVSIVSQSKIVREAMVAEQRKLRSLGVIVMEGRDIGTYVFPDAEYKFFLTASPEARARRRLGQSEENTNDATVASVAREIAERDKIDSQRDLAPLKQAVDAVYIDSSNLSIDEVVDIIVEKIKCSAKISFHEA